MLKDLKKGGTFLLNSLHGPEEMEEKLPAKVKRDLAEKEISFYTIDAGKIAQEIGLGSRINMVMQAAFFKLTEVIPEEDAIRYLKEGIEKTYSKKGQRVIEMNCKAVDQGINAIQKVAVPASWLDAKEAAGENQKLPKFIEEILVPMSRQEGDSLPVSKFVDRADGAFP